MTITEGAAATGKRKVADARTQCVRIHGNNGEHAAIMAAAAQAVLAAGDYLRSLATRDAGPRAQRSESAGQSAELVRVLGLIGNNGSNLNQLVLVANTNGDLPTEAALIEIATQVQVMRDAVMQSLGREA